MDLGGTRCNKTDQPRQGGLRIIEIRIFFSKSNEKPKRILNQRFDIFLKVPSGCSMGKQGTVWGQK